MPKLIFGGGGGGGTTTNVDSTARASATNANNRIDDIDDGPQDVVAAQAYSTGDQVLYDGKVYVFAEDVASASPAADVTAERMVAVGASSPGGGTTNYNDLTNKPNTPYATYTPGSSYTAGDLLIYSGTTGTVLFDFTASNTGTPANDWAEDTTNGNIATVHMASGATLAADDGTAFIYYLTADDGANPSGGYAYTAKNQRRHLGGGA